MRGSIRDKSAGVYELRVSLGRDPITGRYRQLSRIIHGGKRTAQNELAKLITEVQAGKHLATSATVADLMEKWLEHLERLGRAPKTLEGYGSLIKHRILPALGTIEVGKLSAEQLDAFYARLKREGLADPTIHHYHACLSAALRQAVRWGWIDVAPTFRATAPALGTREVRPPTVEEVRSVLEELGRRDPDAATLAYVAATTGCRRGELCGLRWSDVDLEQGNLTINRAISEVRFAGLVVKDTKTHRPRRLALDPATCEVLRAHRAAVQDRAETAGVPVQAGGYVWAADLVGAEPRRPDSITRAWRSATHRLGLGYVRLHDLRHFAATILASAGVDIRTIAGRLGHAHPALTLRTYAHFMESADRQAAEVMGRLDLASRDQDDKHAS